MATSRVRLDPLQGQWEARGYASPVDTDIPLDAVKDRYQVVALVSIVNDTALVRLHAGHMSASILSDFFEALREHGVKHVRWERHRELGIQEVSREI